MKKIYLIGFRGTGFRDAKFSGEPALIRAGHVAIAFEGFEDRILGFRDCKIFGVNGVQRQNRPPEKAAQKEKDNTP